MAELWELVDINMKKTGVIRVRGAKEPFPEGMYHMGAEIWVKNKSGQLLLTLRHPSKEYGNMWECTAGSYIAGEDGAEGAARELKEETGIHALPQELILLGRRVRKNIIVETYLYLPGTDELKLTLQPEEVTDAKWTDIEDVKEHPNMVKNIRDSFALYEKTLREK